VNYEDLFNLTSGVGGDPSESSLFNITTLKELIDLGSKAVDIIDEPEVTGLDLTIFASLTQRLKLA
jgi:hypothetical protein